MQNKPENVELTQNQGVKSIDSLKKKIVVKVGYFLNQGYRYAYSKEIKT